MEAKTRHEVTTLLHDTTKNLKRLLDIFKQEEPPHFPRWTMQMIEAIYVFLSKITGYWDIPLKPPQVFIFTFELTNAAYQAMKTEFTDLKNFRALYLSYSSKNGKNPNENLENQT